MVLTFGTDGIHEEVIMAESIADILKARGLRKMADEVYTEYGSLVSPVCTDTTIIPMLCERLLLRFGKQETAMALLMLFDPASRIDGKMRTGLRGMVAAQLRMSVDSLGRIKKRALWLYTHHRQYRCDVDSAVDEAMKIIKEIKCKQYETTD